jgi:hypothetical protein
VSSTEEVHPEQRPVRLSQDLLTWLTPDRWPNWPVYVFAVAVLAALMLVRLAPGDESVQRPLLILSPDDTVSEDRV